ncbi:MAG: hypothetical protein GF408_07470 [Candidatus Omnitrophica bacterium]|nr:hypothetical protein [Candidatus Omnitrophota bacterium]
MKLARYNKAVSLAMAAVLVFGGYSPSWADHNIKAVRYSDRALSEALMCKEHTLAPTPVSAPVYSLRRDEAGNLSLNKPDHLQQEDRNTEAMLAFLSHSVDNDAGEGPLKDYLRRAIGGNDFDNCRISGLWEYGGKFYTLYLDKRSPLPQMRVLVFSGMRDEAGEGGSDKVKIELADGSLILVQAVGIYEGLNTLPDFIKFKATESFMMVQEVSRAVLNGENAEAAIEMLFTGAGFQGARPGVFALIVNELLSEYGRETTDKGSVKRFLDTVKTNAVEFSVNADLSRAVQLLAGQALTIISWMDRGMSVPSSIRVSSEKEDMVRNDKRGAGMLSAETVRPEIAEVKDEGAPGFYWRGTEGIKKLGSNIPEGLVYSPERFDASRGNMVMYLMDHGFLPVPGGLRAETEKGGISTIHETFFLNDRLPGSYQSTSTGPGHYQGMKLDVKNITEGEGIQFNVRYDTEGNMAEIIAQRLSPGDWAFALPGHVDYVVNLGGLRFNDVSIELDPEDARVFSPNFKFTSLNLTLVGEAVAEKGKTAPYLAALAEGKVYLVKNLAGAPDIKWVKAPRGYDEMVTLTMIYSNLKDGSALESFVEGLKAGYRLSAESGLEPAAMEALFPEKVVPEKKPAGPSLGKMPVLKDYLGKAAGYDAALLGDSGDRDILIRVPVEAVEAIGVKGLRDYLKALQGTSKGHLELFSVDSIGEVSSDEYDRLGLRKEDLPEALRAGSRTRANTVTLLPVLKGEDFTARGREDGDWHLGGMSPKDTIVSPIGLNYDRTGFARGVHFGLLLTEIAKNRCGEEDELVRAVYEEYKDFCLSMGVRSFTLKPGDLVNIALEGINGIARSLKALIDSLPIVPVNMEELIDAYEHARKTLIAA